MFKKETLTILLGIAVVVMIFQTSTLVALAQKVDEAEIGTGGSASPNAVNFADDGSAPTMVGGC